MDHSNASTTLSQVKGDMTRNTLSVMTKIINKYKKNIKIRELAQTIISSVRQKDWKGEAVALQNWVRDNIRYTRDINNVETVGTPDHTLFTRHGDCDDQAILVSTLLQSVGHPTRLVAIGALPGIYNHVYAEVKINGKWLAVETTENWPIGFNPPNVQSKLIYDEKGARKMMNGLAQIIEDEDVELDAALESMVTNALLRESQEELAGCMGDPDLLNGFFSRLRKRVKKLVKRIKPIVKKVAKVAAIGAAVWYTGGAALKLAKKYKAAKAAKKARMQQENAAQQAARAEEVEILRQNAIVEKQNEEYLKQQLAEQNAMNLLQQQGIKIATPEARKVLTRAISLESRKIQAGIPVQEKSIMQKILPAVAIGAPILAVVLSS